MTSVTFISTTSDHTSVLKQTIGSIKDESIEFKYKVKELKDLNDLQYDVLISPANAYGDLRGGIDIIYFQLLGKYQLQDKIKDTIKTQAFGEIHLGDYLMVPLDIVEAKPKILILCPTMTVPTELSQKSRNPYLFMRAVIKAVRKIQSLIPDKKIKILCPIPCVGVGNMDIKLVSKQIAIAIESMNFKGIIHDINMRTKEEEAKCKHTFMCANEPKQNMRMANVYLTTL